MRFDCKTGSFTTKDSKETKRQQLEELPFVYVAAKICGPLTRQGDTWCLRCRAFKTRDTPAFASPA